MADTDGGNIHAKETIFHDKWAENAGSGVLRIDNFFTSIATQERQFALSLMGEIKGKKILDIGPGFGESSIFFAKQGADVTAADISPKMIEICMANAEKHGVKIHGVATSGENLNIEINSFDIVFASSILHHASDRDKLICNIHNALRPGGLFVAIDPLKYNPIINIYRMMATEVRTEDETPLGFSDLNISRKYFPDIKHREFWLLTLVLFLKYYFADKKHPNDFRYWQILLDEDRHTIGRWFTPLKTIDSLLLRLPLVRGLAWYMVQWGTKESSISR